MCLWGENSWCLAIGFFWMVLVVAPTCLAQNISVDYPKEVGVEEEFYFKVRLIDFTADTYDVKIDVFGDGERIAKILNNGKWQSTYYYVNDVIKQDEEKEFLLKILSYTGDADIEIKIRGSGGSYRVFSDYKMGVVESDASKTEQDSGEDEQDGNEEQAEEKEDETKEDIIEDNQQEKQASKPESQKLEVIRLSGKTLINEDDGFNLDLGGEGKTKTFAIAGFMLFMILLLFLFIIKIFRDKLRLKEQVI